MIKKVNDGLMALSNSNQFSFSSSKLLSAAEWDFYRDRQNYVDVLKLKLKDHDFSEPYKLLSLSQVEGAEAAMAKRRAAIEESKKAKDALLNALTALRPAKECAPDGQNVIAINTHIQQRKNEKKLVAAAKKAAKSIPDSKLVTIPSSKPTSLEPKSSSPFSEIDFYDLADSSSSNDQSSGTNALLDAIAQLKSGVMSVAQGGLVCSIVECDDSRNNVEVCDFLDDKENIQCCQSVCLYHRDHVFHKN